MWVICNDFKTPQCNHFKTPFISNDTIIYFYLTTFYSFNICLCTIVRFATMLNENIYDESYKTLNLYSRIANSLQSDHIFDKSEDIDIFR